MFLLSSEYVERIWGRVNNVACLPILNMPPGLSRAQLQDIKHVSPWFRSDSGAAQVDVVVKHVMFRTDSSQITPLVNALQVTFFFFFITLQPRVELYTRL